MLRRLLATVATLLVCAPLAGLALRTPIIDRMARAKVADVAARLGVEVAVGEVLPWGWTGGTLSHIRLGPADAPLVTIRSARAALSWREAAFGPRRPALIEAEGVVVHIRGDGTLRGALEALRDAAPDGLRREGASDAESGGAPSAPAPVLRASDVRLLDHGGAVAAGEGAFEVRDRRITGTITFSRPDLGRCAVELDRHAGKVSCERPFEAPLPAGLRIGARALELQLRPRKRVRVSEVRVAAGAAGGRLAAVVGGLAADVTVELERDAAGQFPVTARLRLPGGAAIEAEGSGNRQGGVVSADVRDFDLGKLHGTVQGTLSGRLDLRVDREKRTVALEGKADLTGFTVTHAALAEGPIGPMALSAAGRINASALVEGPLDKGRITLEGGRLTVGDAVLTLDAAVDTLGEAPVIEAKAEVPPMPASQLAASIPAGLLPHLQPLEGTGRFGFKGELRIDFAKLADTVLTAKADVGSLKVTKTSPKLDFDGLRTTFTTHFEMPDGRVIDRTTGPETDRWTPLSAMSPLLPLAVITQEDGGFYRHGGISMFHLRASLVRNLERGRFARGGSTLSMQLARNLFLHRKKTLARKLEELVLTWLLERRFSKDELIALYLNVVEFGTDVFGIKDAAQHYFEKTPAELDPVEMVFLVRLLPSPRRWGKQKNKGKLDTWYVKRMNRLLDLLAERGHLPREIRDACDAAALWQGQTVDPSVLPPPLPNGQIMPPPWSPLPAPVPSIFDPEVPPLPAPVAPLAPAPPEPIPEIWD